MKNSIFEDALVSKPKRPEPDLGRCCNYDCGKVSKVEDFMKDYGHHDGWEMKPYTELLCPHCDDGVAEDLFYRDEQWSRYVKFEADVVTDDRANK